MERFFVDTSAWFAFVNARDADHGAVRAVLTDLQGRLVTSSYVFDESVTLCRYRMGHATAVRVGRAITESVDLVRPLPADEREAWDLFVDREDKTYSFTDCTSFVIMHRLRIATAIALDDDFSVEGFQTLP